MFYTFVLLFWRGNSLSDVEIVCNEVSNRIDTFVQYMSIDESWNDDIVKLAAQYQITSELCS